jgi:tetratricopeptide (TPR) repeat protein
MNGFSFRAPGFGFYLILENLRPPDARSRERRRLRARIGASRARRCVLKNREVTERLEYRDFLVRASPRGFRIAPPRGKAAELYFEPPGRRGAFYPDDSMALANWLAENGHPRAALTLYQRHLRDYPRGPGAAEAHAYAGLLQLHALGEPTAAYQHLVEALDYDPSPELENLIRRGLATSSAPEFQVPRVH